MPTIDITPQKFEELKRKGYNLDLILFLMMINENCDFEMNGAIIVSIEQTARRKGLMDDKGLTPEGKELLSFISSTEESPKIVRKKREQKPQTVDNFTQWWKAYPATDTFKYKGKEFTGTRALRVKKAECEVKIDKILASGEYKIEELIAALKLEISQKAENSIKTNTNKMSYFQNSLTYLNQATYDPYVELVRAGHKPKEETKTVSNETFI